MFETCPICGRYSLSREYPPKPCSICEEEMLNKRTTPPHLPMNTPQPPNHRSHA